MSNGGRRVYLLARIVGALMVVSLAIGGLALGANLGIAGAPQGSGNSFVFVYVYPRVIIPPRVQGTAQVGDALTVQHGLYLHHPTSFSEQWLRCSGRGACVAINGATGVTYVLTLADRGHRLRVEETARNAQGDGSQVISRPSALVRLH